MVRRTSTPGQAEARTSSRKVEHVELAASAEVGSAADAGWGDVRLVPTALPEQSLGDVDLTTEFLGRPLAAPIAIASMTGGHADLAPLNLALGEAAEQLGLVVGVGSQRAALADPTLAPSFAAIRKNAPTTVVLANVGAAQLIEQSGSPALGAEQVRAAIDMVRADGLAVHLNVVQESIQTEGDRITGPFLPAIEALVGSCGVPIIVKETGSGMTGDDARRLADVGVAAIDVGGAGGTSFVDIEGARAERAGDERGARLGSTFSGWGVPTAAAILETRTAALPVIATGGVRTGLDAAKALALGASLVGVGRLAIVAALEGVDRLVAQLRVLIDELRLALLLNGARTPGDLARTAPVLTGDTLAWAQQRHLLGR
jgi:isopentenyl-diphosphate delta-isomerase